MSEKIPRKEAIERVKNAERGTLILSEVEPKPTIGEIPVDEKEFVVTVESYQFGEWGNE